MNSHSLRKPLLFFLLCLVGWGLFSLLPVSWQGWQPATCLASGCFCEAPHAGALVQPANSWSSLAFVLPGLLVLALPLRPNRRFDAPPAGRAYRRIYGAALLVIGLGSAFYHASLTFAGQFFDVTGMYLLISFAALYRAAPLLRLGGRGLAAAYLAVNLLLAGLLLGLPAVRREVFAAAVLAYLGLEGWHNRRRGWSSLRGLAPALGAMTAAYLIWILDNSGVLCSPLSWLQGHAAWHVLGALAAWLLFRYFWAEEVEPQK